MPLPFDRFDLPCDGGSLGMGLGVFVAVREGERSLLLESIEVSRSRLRPLLAFGQQVEPPTD